MRAQRHASNDPLTRRLRGVPRRGDESTERSDRHAGQQAGRDRRRKRQKHQRRRIDRARDERIGAAPDTKNVIHSTTSATIAPIPP